MGCSVGRAPPWIALAPLIALVAMVGWGCTPPARAPDPRDDGAAMLGCYRVALGPDARLRMDGLPHFEADPAFADGTLYCIDPDRYHVKPPGADWNTVPAPWQVDAIWAPPKRRVGTAWGSGVPPPYGVVVVREDGRYRLEGALSVRLQRLDDEAEGRARGMIALLPRLETLCAEAAAALESVAALASDDADLCDECDSEIGAAVDALPEGDLAISLPSSDRARCSAVLQTTRAHLRRIASPPPPPIVPADPDPPIDETDGIDDTDDTESLAVDDLAAPIPATPFDPARHALLDINAIPQAQVIVDGRPAGRTPLIGFRVNEGLHTVVFAHPKLGRRTITTRVTRGQRRTIAVHLGRP